MAVTEETPITSAVANGVTTVFPFAWTLLDEADIVVKKTIDGLTSTYTYGIDYSVSGVGSGTGSVTFIAAPETGAIITMYRDTALLRETDYQDNGDLLADSVNLDFDRLWMAMQDILTGGKAAPSSLRVPNGETVSELPAAASRAGYFLGFDGSGQPALLAATAGTAAALSADLVDATTGGKGDTLIGYSAIFSIASGALTRHASLNAAITAVGATLCTIVVRSNTSLTANATVAATTELRIENEAQINFNTFTLTVNGRFYGPRAKCFTGTGKVVFAKGSIPHVVPEWWGAAGDGVIADGSGTDSAAAFTAAVAASCENGISDVSIHPVHASPGNYVVGALSFPPAFKMYGAGRQLTNFIAKTGTAGVWFGDSGSAAKVVLEGFAMYGRDLTGITYGLRLGYGATQHGVEGHCRDLFVRDIGGASAVWGVDLNGNVAFYENIAAYDCTSNIRITGIANTARNLVSYAPVTTGVDLNLCDVFGLEIEAPGNSCVPLKLSGNASVHGLIVSLANSTTISHLVELAAQATTWKVTPFNLAFGSTPAGITVSNGNFKRSDGSYFGGNATAGSRNGEGNYYSDFAGQRSQCFVLSIFNNAGTLQHKITEPGVNGATNWAGLINGASSSFGNTPTGADGSTAMATGGKIGSASTNVFWLDTAAQKAADSQFSASIQFNSTGTALTITPGIVSLNINGTTRARLSFQFNNATTGAAFGLTTANIGAGTFIQVLFNGRLS